MDLCYETMEYTLFINALLTGKYDKTKDAVKTRIFFRNYRHHEGLLQGWPNLLYV